MKKLTYTQGVILRDIDRGRNPFRTAYGLSQHGGYGGSLKSMEAKGWLTWEGANAFGGYRLTALGEKILKQGGS